MFCVVHDEYRMSNIVLIFVVPPTRYHHVVLAILEEFPNTDIPPIEEFLAMTTSGIDEELLATLPEFNDFDEKINEVMEMMDITGDGDGIPPESFKTLLGSLIESANTDSRSREEHRANMDKVENLVNVFMKENAERARQTLNDRKPKINPVLESNKKFNKMRKNPFPTPPSSPFPTRPSSPFPTRSSSPFPTRSSSAFPTRPNSAFPTRHGSNKKTDARKVPTKVKGRNDNAIRHDNGNAKENFRSNTKKADKNIDKTRSHFSDLLDVSNDKDRMEDHIMDMIITDPGNAANVLSDLFVHETLKDKVETRNELKELMSKDPMAVGAAFSDLMTRHNMPLPDTNEEPRSSPKNGNNHKFPRPIKAPPKKVQGQLLRFWSNHEGAEEDRTSLYAPPPPRNNGQEDIEIVKALPDEDDAKLSSNVLDTMLKLIETGEMSSEDVIEEMINNGMLPVEVTDIGKLPITIGKGKDREAVSLKRLQQLRIKEPSIVMKDDRHEMVDVGLDDPDFDVENLGGNNGGGFVEDFGPIKTHGNLDVEDVVFPEQVEKEKDIDVEDSLITLHEQGLINEEELKEMMEILGLEPKDGPKGKGASHPTYKPPPIGSFIHPQNHYLTRGTYGNKHLGSSIDFDNQPPPTPHQLRLRLPNNEPPSSYTYFEMQLGKHPEQTTPRIKSHQPFRSSYKTSPYLPQDFHQAPRSLSLGSPVKTSTPNPRTPNPKKPASAPLKKPPPRPKKHVKSNSMAKNNFRQEKEEKPVQNQPVPAIHEAPFFEALKLENPFKDEFDDDFMFENGAPEFIPDFDSIEADDSDYYDDYDPYIKSKPYDHTPTINFREERLEHTTRPAFFQDSDGTPVLVATPPKQKQKFYRDIPKPRKSPYTSKAPSLSKSREKEYESHHHPFQTSYSKSFGNYGQKRLEFNPLLQTRYEDRSILKEPEVRKTYHSAKEDFQATSKLFKSQEVYNPVSRYEEDLIRKEVNIPSHTRARKDFQATPEFYEDSAKFFKSHEVSNPISRYENQLVKKELNVPPYSRVRKDYQATPEFYEDSSKFFESHEVSNPISRYEEELVQKQQNIPSHGRARKDHQATPEFYEETRKLQYDIGTLTPNFKRDIASSFGVGFHEHADFENSEAYNSPREPFAPPDQISSHDPFRKSQEYERDARKYSPRSDNKFPFDAHIGYDDRPFEYSEDFDPFKELEDSGIDMFGAPFESTTKSSTFSNFEFRKRIGLIDPHPYDLVAHEATGEDNRKRTEDTRHGPTVRSLGEVTSWPSRRNDHYVENNLSNRYGVPSFTTIRPFAYTTSPETGSRLGNRNIKNIRKSFVFGEKINAAFQ